MHIHILGICGTFMAGIATLAKKSGHKVTGCDQNVYPPMSTQLNGEGITIIEGFDDAQIILNPDLFIIGNVISRGNPLMETILNLITSEQMVCHQVGTATLKKVILVTIFILKGPSFRSLTTHSTAAVSTKIEPSHAH